VRWVDAGPHGPQLHRWHAGGEEVGSCGQIKEEWQFVGSCGGQLYAGRHGCGGFCMPCQQQRAQAKGSGPVARKTRAQGARTPNSRAHNRLGHVCLRAQDLCARSQDRVGIFVETPCIPGAMAAAQASCWGRKASRVHTEGACHRVTPPWPRPCPPASRYCPGQGIPVCVCVCGGACVCACMRKPESALCIRPPRPLYHHTLLCALPYRCRELHCTHTHPALPVKTRPAAR